MKRGKLIVFEGLDGSGKATQTRLLKRRLKQDGHRVRAIDFPQYGTRSAGLIELYLTRAYGAAHEVNPYAASLFYACDRFDASAKIRTWLDHGDVVIADRYTISNVGHQGARFVKHLWSWKKYVAWLHHLEYKLLEIPKPDYVLLLVTDPASSHRFSPGTGIGKKAAKRKSYLGIRKRDMLEADIRHLAAARKSYLQYAAYMPKLVTAIDCIENGSMRTIHDIHKEVWNLVTTSLKRI